MLQASWVHVYLSYPLSGMELARGDVLRLQYCSSRGRPSKKLFMTAWGFVVPVNDHNLLQTCLALLGNSSLRSELGIAARQTALAWDQSVMLPRLATLIEGWSEMILPFPVDFFIGLD